MEENFMAGLAALEVEFYKPPIRGCEFSNVEIVEIVDSTRTAKAQIAGGEFSDHETVVERVNKGLKKCTKSGK